MRAKVLAGLRALGGVCALIFCLVAPAEAAPQRTGAATGFLSHLQLPGNGTVAWLDTVCVRYCRFYSGGGPYTQEARFVTVRPDGRARRSVAVRRAEIGSPETYDDTSIVATPQAVAVRSGKGYSGRYGFSAGGKIAVGRTLGSLRTVFACSLVARSFGVGSLQFDLDGQTVVYEDGCARDVLRLWVATADGQRRVVYEGAKEELAGLAIRGEYLGALIYATDEGPRQATLNVFDRTGRRLVQITPEPNTYFWSLALGSDGSVVTSSRATTPSPGSCSTGLSWASVARPTLHPIATTGCPYYPKLTGRTVYYSDGSDIHAVGLEGGDRLVVDRGNVDAEGSPFESTYDADASLVTYGLRACDGSAVIRTIPASATTGRESSRCTARFVSRRRLKLRRKGIRVALRCPRGCTGRLTVRRGRREVRYDGDDGFEQSRRLGRYRIRLDDRTLGLLSARGSLRLVVSARVQQRSQRRFRTIRQRVRVVR